MKKNRWLALLLVMAVFVLVCAVTGAAAESGTWGDNLTWTLEGGKLTISGTGEMGDCQNAPWHGYLAEITSAETGAGVTTIGDSAFYALVNLESVTIRGNVTRIEGGAFMGCALQSIKLPQSLTSIGNAAFAANPFLTGIVIPGNVTLLGDNVFANCNSLRTVVMPAGLNSIGADIFQECPLQVTVETPCTSAYVPQWAAANNIPCKQTHSLKGTAAAKATCTAAGNSAYWTCETCGAYFSDAEGTTVIAKDSWVIPATGHNLEQHAAKAATCTAAGNSAYWSCKNCDTYFSNAGGTAVIAKDSWVIPAPGHDLEHHAGQAATCTEAGWNAYDTCKRCDYTSYTKIAALGHSWKATTYTWAKDNSTVKAKRVCARNSSHVESEKAATIYKVTKKPTYTTAGVGTWTTKPFTNKAFKTQTKKVTLDKLARTSISKAKIKAIDDQIYTGSAIKPALSVKYNGKKLAKGTDYSVTFENNVKPGKATVTVKGKNAWKGSVTITFKILPKPVKLLSLVPQKKKIAVMWKKGSAITGYDIEYATKKDFSNSNIISIKGALVITAKIGNLKPGKTYYVRIRGYRTVGGKVYYSPWSDKMKATVPAE